jgi:uncharacterized protein (TIGR02145 family)
MEKNSRIRNVVSLIIGLFLLLLNGCDKDDDIRIQFNQNLDYGSLTDNEGNIYKTIKIGTQTWMAENLRVTKLNDGTDIPYNSYPYQDSTPAFKWYLDNPIFYKNTIGGLYNWYALNTGKLCPSGWHIPTDNEWNLMTDYLGGDSIAGAKMKETGTKNWKNPNEGASNESGFTALPTFGYPYGGTFSYTLMWSSTEFNNEYAWYRSLSSYSKKVYRHFETKKVGSPIRCVRDE